MKNLIPSIKIIVSILFITISFVLNAQKVRSKYTNYYYLRSPLQKPSIASKSYQVETTIEWAKKDKAIKAQYEANLKQAEDDYQRELKAHKGRKLGTKLVEKTLLGNTTPTKRHVYIPDYRDTPEPSSISNKIHLDGFERTTEHELLIKIIIEDATWSTAREKTSKNKEGVEVIQLEASGSQPIHYEVYNKNGDKLYTEIVKKTLETIKVSSGKYTKYSKEWYAYKKNNWANAYRTRKNSHLEKLLGEVNKSLNSQFGYSKMKRFTEVYIGAGKKHDYTQHEITATYTLRAFETFLTENENSISKFNKALSFWKNELKSATKRDKKAKINEQVTAALYCNHVEILILMRRYSEAQEILDKIDLIPDVKKKIIKRANNLRGFLKGEKVRNPST